MTARKKYTKKTVPDRKTIDESRDAALQLRELADQCSSASDAAVLIAAAERIASLATMLEACEVLLQPGSIATLNRMIVQQQRIQKEFAAIPRDAQASDIRREVAESERDRALAELRTLKRRLAKAGCA